uniref:Uncharacterized protein n=1 Tax=Octopus bimaculoides TaxID=37653 RepID=A0A0L8FYY9_OCTBM
MYSISVFWDFFAVYTTDAFTCSVFFLTHTLVHSYIFFPFRENKLSDFYIA